MSFNVVLSSRPWPHLFKQQLKLAIPEEEKIPKLKCDLKCDFKKCGLCIFDHVLFQNAPIVERVGHGGWMIGPKLFGHEA